MSVKILVIFVVAALFGATQALLEPMMAVVSEYRQICINKSGSESAYQQVLESIEPAKACFHDQVVIQQLRRDVQELARRGARKPFFDKYCPKFNESIDCFDDTLAGIAKCSGDDVVRVKPMLKKIAHDLLDLACQNEGQFFFDMQIPKFKECFEQLGERECKLSDTYREVAISSLGEKECREMSQALKCAKEHADECGAPRLFDAIKVIFNVISETNDCNQYTNLGGVPGNNFDGEITLFG